MQTHRHKAWYSDTNRIQIDAGREQNTELHFTIRNNGNTIIWFTQVPSYLNYLTVSNNIMYTTIRLQTHYNIENFITLYNVNFITFNKSIKIKVTIPLMMKLS